MKLSDNDKINNYAIKEDKMKLRFFEVYNKDGLTVESGLQVWSEEYSEWEFVNIVRVPEKEREIAQRDKNYI